MDFLYLTVLLILYRDPDLSHLPLPKIGNRASICFRPVLEGTVQSIKKHLLGTDEARFT